MATPDFVYQDPLQITKDTTQYRLLTKDYVSVSKFDGKEILKIEPEGLTLLANVAIRDVSFLLRTAHLEKVAAILKDSQASDNDRYVALAMLRNADTAAKGILPFCQDTGTATIFGKKGQQVWTGVKDEEHLAKVSTKLSPKKTCVTRRPRRSTCMRKWTPERIYRRKSI